MDKLVFQMDNNFKDYLPLYPSLSKHILFINKWTKYVLGLFFLLLIISIVFSMNPSLAKKEFGYVATAATVVLVPLTIMIAESISKKKKTSAFVNYLVSKGPALVTIDFVGIEIKYAREIKLVEWENSTQLLLENTHLMSSDHMGNPSAIVPKGNMTDDKWIEIQELTAAIVKEAAAKRHRLHN